MNSKNNNDISIVYLNIGSLPYHLEELRHFLISTNCYPEIICLAETKITETVNTEFHPELENYTYINVVSSSASGSVGAFIKNNIKYKVRQDLNFWQSRMFETLWLEIDINKNINAVGII